MRRPTWPSLVYVVVLAMVWAGLPSFASGQVAASQIQVSNADAVYQIDLTAPAGLQAAQASMLPSIRVVDADAIGRVTLADIGEQIAAEAPAADSQAPGATAPSLPVPRIQVASADAIGRFELHPPDAPASDDDNSAQTSAATALTLAVRIQVSNADAIGSFALRQIDAPNSAPQQAGSTPVVAELPEDAAGDAPVTGEAVVITDGKLNVRSGPGRQFDVVGQLDDGEVVTVLKSSDDGAWLLTMSDSGLTGWVSAQFVEFR